MATPTPSDLERKAQEAFFDDDFHLAAALYTQAIAAGAPSAAALYADRAQTYIKMGDFAAAAADAARAAELDPAMPRAHVRRAQACVELEQYDAARAAVEAGAAVAPADKRFARLMKEIDAKAPKPMETEDSAAAAAKAPKPMETEESAAAAAAVAPAPAEKPKYRHDYYNSAAEVVVTVFAKGVAAEHVAVEFGEQMLSVSVEVPGEAPYHLQPRLFGKIVPGKTFESFDSHDFEQAWDKIIAKLVASISSYENSAPTSSHAPTAPAEIESQGNFHGATLLEGEVSLDVLNFSTTPITIEQPLVKTSVDFSLSHADLVDAPCDKNDPNDNSFVVPKYQLMNEHAVDVLESITCAENRHVFYICSEKDERRLLSSMNTLGYVEFDNLCDMSYLEENIFGHTDLPRFSKHIYHVIGKYNNKGEYMVHRVYICANLKPPFDVQDCDQLDCPSSFTITNRVYS